MNLTSATTLQPRISVVFPVKNERALVRECVEAILSQTIAQSVEIIAVDSGSTDGTLDILAQYPVRVHRISPAEFNHGETRNVGVRLARGEFVVLTVADARAVDDRWLERLLRHFDDSRVAGVCGQQIVPHEPDKNPLQWFRPYNKPEPRKIWFRDREEFESLPPREQLALCSWDDVTAMYRRDALLRIPFRPVSFAEDIVWARDALLAGLAIVYDYSARVYHYHHETFGFRFRRTYTIHYHAHQVFGATPRTEPLLLELARNIYRASRRKYCPHHRLYWITYNIRLTVSEWLAIRGFSLVAKLGKAVVITKINSWFFSTAPQANVTRRTETVSKETIRNIWP